jgi:hypothetical protein
VQAFQLAGVCGLNLSYGSLTSFATRETLRQLKTLHSDFWKELDEGQQHTLADLEAAASEDQRQGEILVDDNSAVSNRQVAAEMVSGNKATDIESVGDQSSWIVATGEAESLEFSGGEAIVRDVEEQLGCGK